MLVLTLTLVFLGLAAMAVCCGVLLVRPKRAPVADVSPMKATLERRLREGAEFRL